MELEKLEQQRDAYAGKISKLAIQIAIIFAIPAALAVGCYFLFDISVWYTIPAALIISWTLTIVLYQRVDKAVRDLEKRIIELKKEAASDTNDQ